MSTVEHDLRQHSASEARAEALYDAYAKGVIDYAVERIMAGETVKIFGKPYAAQDFIRDGLGADDGHEGVECFMDCEDAANLVCGSMVRLEETRERLAARLERRIRNWLDWSRPAQEWVMEKCREAQEDAMYRYREE